MNLTPILLVEDNDIDAEAVRRALRKANVDNPLHTVCDGVEALDVLRGQNGKEALPQPCIMLLDINLPRMNGFELLREIRSDEKMKQNVVFMLTTSARNLDMKTAYGFHVAGYILKENVRPLAEMLGSYCTINAFPD